MADDFFVTLMNLSKTSFENLTHSFRIARKVLRDEFFEICQRGGAADRVAGVRTGHRAGRELVHNVGTANNR